MGTFVLTGANGGIGSATASELAHRGHEVIAINRSDADLSSMQEVNRLADALLARYDHLDGLLLNAGTASPGTQLTPEGFEETFAVNHLGAFLLAHRLLPLLQRGDPGRIVLTGSSDHMGVSEVSVPDIASSTTAGYIRAYANSKAVAMAAMLEMARRFKPEEVEEEDEQPGFVRVNVADPGWTRTGLTRNAPLPIRLLVRVGRPMQNRPKHSARVLADLAIDEMDTGTYTGLKGRMSTSALLRDELFRKQVYDDTAQLLVEHGLASVDDFLLAR